MPSKKPPESDLPIELSFKVGGLQINAKGTITELAKQITSISEFAELATAKLIGPSTEVPHVAGPTSKDSAEVEPPVIKVTKSTAENVKTLFSTSWGKSPRNLGDVSKALEVNAAPDSSPKIATSLLNLVKAGELRRLKKDGAWHYFRVPSS